MGLFNSLVFHIVTKPINAITAEGQCPVRPAKSTARTFVPSKSPVCPAVCSKRICHPKAFAKACALEFWPSLVRPIFRSNPRLQERKSKPCSALNYRSNPSSAYGFQRSWLTACERISSFCPIALSSCNESCADCIFPMHHTARAVANGEYNADRDFHRRPRDISGF